MNSSLPIVRSLPIGPLPQPQGCALVCQHGDRLTGFGESGECSEPVPPRLVPPGCGVQALNPVPRSEPMLWGGRTEAGNPPCSVGFRVFQFYFRFLFLLFFLSPFPLHPLA